MTDTTMNTGAASLSEKTYGGYTVAELREFIAHSEENQESIDYITGDDASSAQIIRDLLDELATPQADAAPIISGHAVSELFLKWSEWTTELGEAISRKNIDGFASELRSFFAVPLTNHERIELYELREAVTNPEMNTLVIQTAREVGLRVRVDSKMLNDNYTNVTGSFPSLVRFASVLLARQPAAIDKQEAVTSDWLQSGSLLYRLTDERRPKNRDEINVTMADGSRDDEMRNKRASAIKAILDAAPLANEASKPAPSVERMTVSQAPNSQYAIGWNACLDAIGAAPSVEQDETEALRAIIDEVHEWAVCACIASPEDMAQNFPRIVEITSPDYRAASTSANVAQGATSHERIWLENRANIISAINAAGFELSSNKDGWWLAKRPVDKAAALAANVAQGADSGECLSCIGGKCVTGKNCVTLGRDSFKCGYCKDTGYLPDGNHCQWCAAPCTPDGGNAVNVAQGAEAVTEVGFVVDCSQSIDDVLPADRRWTIANAISIVAEYRNCPSSETKEVMQRFATYMRAALANAAPPSLPALTEHDLRNIEGCLTGSGYVGTMAKVRAALTAAQSASGDTN